MFAVSAFTRRNFAHETRLLFGWGFAGRFAMLLPCRVAGRTLGVRGPDLAVGRRLPDFGLDLPISNRNRPTIM